jgi:hypothetical protein
MVERRSHVPARRHRLSTKTALNERGLTGHLISTCDVFAALTDHSGASVIGRRFWTGRSPTGAAREEKWQTKSR